MIVPLAEFSAHTYWAIALSIAFVAVEMPHEATTGRPSLTRRRPWLVVFVFGLLHGFEFASALSELQIPRSALPITLFCFNFGVEIGQLLFVAVLLALRPAWRRIRRAAGTRADFAACHALGTTAMYWFFERIVAFGEGH